MANAPLEAEDEDLVNRLLLAERLHWTLEYIDGLDVAEYHRIWGVFTGLDRARSPGKTVGSPATGGHDGIRRTTVIGGD